MTVKLIVVIFYFENMDKEQNSIVTNLPHRHMLLNLLVEFDEFFGLDVTLSVNGMLVSGHIIGASKWFSELSEGFSHLPQSEDENVRTIAEGFQNSFQKISEECKPAGKTSLEEDSTVSREFIYLQDVDIITPGLKPFRYPLWCCRLDDVDGFTFGRTTFGA